MKKNLLFVLSFLLSVTSCELHRPDFFVPMADFEKTEDLAIDSNGKTGTLTISSNTQWIAESSMEWLVLSKTSGTENDEIGYTITSTKTARRAEIILYPVEIPDRISKIVVKQSGTYEISKVERPEVTDAMSITGTTATVNATFEGYSLNNDSNINGWFMLSSGENESKKIDAIVNKEFKTLYATIDNLTPQTEYSITAYVQLEKTSPVHSEPAKFKTELIPPTIETVENTVASKLSSKTGKTATLSSSFTGLSLIDASIINTGFTISAEGVEQYSVNAETTLFDMTKGTFTADIDNLIAEKEYTVFAWVRIKDEKAVNGEPSTFKTEISIAAEPVTLIGDFTSNDTWNLPSSDKKMEDKEVSIKDNKGYTWVFSGCAISSGSLWMASQSKKNFQGYVILPKFDNLTVTYISFPNDGSGPSGKAAITIYVSEDNGNTFNALYSNIKLSAQHEFALSDQKPGSIYKIMNDNGPDGSNGYSKTQHITVKAE